MAIEGYSMATLCAFVGKELGVSEWMEVDQARINAFAECTEDRQWIHVDVERARKESPFGGTIAHGYLTLSLLSAKLTGMGVVPGDARAAVNYGLEKTRFLAPVRAGVRVRNRVRLLSVDDKGDGRVLLRMENTMEVEGEARPAMVAEALALVMA